MKWFNEDPLAEPEPGMPAFWSTTVTRKDGTVDGVRPNTFYAVAKANEAAKEFSAAAEALLEFKDVGNNTEYDLDEYSERHDGFLEKYQAIHRFVAAWVDVHNDHDDTEMVLLPNLDE